MELCSYECFVDVQKSKQMLLNILNNACKFTSAKGTISIKCENEKLDIVAGTATDKIIISDTGCGMSEDFLKKIFTPFEQERNVYTGSIQGTGLGLSLARSIARAEGGDITVESELGKGSTFTIHFPYKFRLIQESEKTVISHSEILRGNLNGKHILLAEDNKLNATIATRLLEKYGAKVTWVEDGKLAISEIENNPEDTFDIILMDIRMPNMDGLEATKKIRSLNRKDARNIPIVAMTANAFEEDRRSSLEAGMNAHLTKPINPEELFQTISKFVK